MNKNAPLIYNNSKDILLSIPVNIPEGVNPSILIVFSNFADRTKSFNDVGK